MRASVGRRYKGQVSKVATKIAPDLLLL